MDVRKTLAHHHALWRRFGDFYVDECSWDELSEERGASHGSIANLTMHAVNMEDWWLHSIWPGKEWDGPAWDGFTSAKAMRERIHDVEGKTQRLLAELTDAQLREARRVSVGEDAYEVSLEDILTEVVTEAGHHRGEIMALFWHRDKETPYQGYLEWVAEGA